MNTKTENYTFDNQLRNKLATLKLNNVNIEFTPKLTVEELIRCKYFISRNELFEILQLYINAFIVEKNLHYTYSTYINVHPIYDFIKTLFPNNFQAVCQIFRNFIYHNYIYYKNKDIEYNKLNMYIFNSFMSFKCKYLNKAIAAGSQAAVFDMDTYIIKIFFHTIDKNFYKYVYNNEYLHFPKIYHYLNTCVCVEKLKLYTPKCKQYVKLLSYYDKSSYYYKIKNDREFYNNCNLSDDEKEIIKWGTDIFNTNMRIEYDDFYDISLDNIGERENGDIILFDP